MKTMLIPILTLAAATSPAITAFADLTRKASSEFDYKYEMVARPDLEDVDGSGTKDLTGWSVAFSLGSGEDLGTITLDASSNGKYLVSNKDSGEHGDGWRTLAPSSSSGFTIEARVKVLECTGNNGAICIEAGPSDSKVYARLNLFDGKIGWNGTVLKTMDTKSDFHTYRITREGGKAVHSVYVDGVLVAENLGTGFTYDNSVLYRMLLGSPGSGWTGKAQIAWLRFDKGAYAPVDEKAYVKANRLRSDEFAVKYEMNVDDTVGAKAGTTSDWKTTIDSRVGDVSKAGGVLSVVAGGYPAYWDTTDTAWKNLVSATTPYTVEFNIKVDSSDENDRSINMTTGSAGAVGNLFVGAASVQWSPDMTKNKETFVTLDTSNNTDKFHTFRIAYDGATRHGFTVWRDDVVIGENLVDCVNFYNFNGNALGIVRFGKAGGFNNGTFHVNYVRWQIGGVYPPDTRKGMMVIVK